MIFIKRYQKSQKYQALSDKAKLIYDHLVLPLFFINNFELSNEHLSVLFGLDDMYLHKIKRIINEFKETAILDIETETIQVGLTEYKKKRIIQLKDIPKYKSFSEKLEWFYHEFIEEVN